MGNVYAVFLPRLSTGILPLTVDASARVKSRNMEDGIKRRIEQRLAELGLSPRAASIKAGGSSDLIRGLLRGKQKSFRGDNLTKIADMLGVSTQWLLTGKSDPTGDPVTKPMIPVVGYVGAGAEVFCIDDHAKGAGLDEVEVPIDGMSRSTVAVRVRGESMLPVYRPGDLIFYDRNDNGDLLHLIGKDCVVRLTDGRTFLKELHHTNGEFWLHSYNSTPMMKVEIEWAAKVAVIKRA